MIKLLKIIDKILRGFKRCIVLEVDNSNDRFEVKNIYIDKVL